VKVLEGRVSQLESMIDRVNDSVTKLNGEDLVESNSRLSNKVVEQFDKLLDVRNDEKWSNKEKLSKCPTTTAGKEKEEDNAQNHIATDVVGHFLRLFEPVADEKEASWYDLCPGNFLLI
jgi:hypothetical protein